jgi:hypothetical protein
MCTTKPEVSHSVNDYSQLEASLGHMATRFRPHGNKGDLCLRCFSFPVFNKIHQYP